MTYSKLRGARKLKKKEEKGADLSGNDAFQEQGKKVVDKLLSHPYFVIGTVAVIIVVIAAAVAVSTTFTKSGEESAFNFSKAVEIFNSKTGESTEFTDDNQKYAKAVEAFGKIVSEEPDSFNAAASLVYIGGAYRAMNNCEKAVDFFQKAEKSGKLKPDMLIGAYEGQAFCYLDKGEFEKAIEVWKKWLNQKTSIYMDYALYYIGMSYEKLGKQNEAAVYYKRLKDEHPDSVLIAKIIDRVPKEDLPANKEPTN